MLEPDGSPNTAHSTNPVPRDRHRRGDRAARRRHPRRRRPDRPRPARHPAARGDDGAARCPSIGLDRRNDPARLSFEIQARDGDARTGLIHVGHGPVPTPAFIPLATKGSVRGLSSAEVAGLGYEMVLGNTFHLHLAPGEERDRGARRPAPLHGLGAGDHHRLGRLPGLLARPRRGCRRDQGTARERRRAEPRSRSPRRGSPSSRCSTARTASSGPRSRCGSRRRSAPTSP